jgi:lipoprotein-anchoring transpeptidase ErfK/SrfK
MRGLLIFSAIFIFLAGVFLFYFGGFNLLVLVDDNNAEVANEEYLIGNNRADQYELFHLNKEQNENLTKKVGKNKEKRILAFPQTDTFAPESDTQSWPGVAPKKKGKVIEIVLSTQRLLAWENGELLGNFSASTGKPSTPTKQGVFQVQTKLPMAYGSGDGDTWAMPYWLGVYNAGNTENGIHGLPYINGYKESHSSLGHPISHGCVRIADQNQEWLYSWVELGTPVYINWSPTYN